MLLTGINDFSKTSDLNKLKEDNYALRKKA